MIRQGHSECWVSVLIEKKDGSIEYRHWTGRSFRRLQKKARARYAAEFPSSRVSFGRPLWQNYYGAH